jgi:signal transduction histidine kinase/integral membrane sensor domain MASE1
MGSARLSPRARLALDVLACALLYFVTGKVGLMLASVGTSVTLVWPPTGIAIAFLFRRGPRLALGVFLGALAVNLTLGPPPLSALLIACGNTAGPVVTSLFLRRAAFRPTFQGRRDIGWFALASAIGLVVPATIGVLALLLVGAMPVSAVAWGWTAWWAGDLIGALIAGPVALGIGIPAVFPARHGEGKELTLIVLVMLAIAGGTYAQRGLPVGYLALLPLAWAALRFPGVRSASIMLLLSTIAVIGTTLGRGPFGPGQRGLFLLAGYLGTAATLHLIIVAVTAERATAEATARASEVRRIDALLAAGAGSLHWDLATDVVTLGEGYGARWGLGDRTTGKELLLAVHADDRAALEEAIGAAREGHGTLAHQCRVRAGATERWMALSGRFEYDDAGAPECLTGIVQDVTARVLLQTRLEEQRTESLRARAELEKQLLQAQKMEALGTLAGGIAHDFNNILAAIVGNVDLARDQLPAQHAALEPMQEVMVASLRARDLVRQILTFASQKHAQRVPTRVAPIAEETVRLLRASLPASIRIDAKLDDARLTVLGDASQLQQVIMNLCTNAAHAMKGKDGVLTLRLEPLEVDAAYAAHSAELREGPYVHLSVTDEGHGIPRDQLGRIFDPFFTTKGPGEGTGLGLAVVHGIVRGHGGALYVESEENVGSTFHVYLPAIETIATHRETAAPPPQAGGGQHILVVDDEPALVRLGERLLKRLGYRATGTTSPTVALDLATQSGGDIALVITDLTMPGMKGTELARRIHEVRPDLPVLLTTGYGGDLSSDAVEGADFTETLSKPFTPQTLAASIRRALTKS